MPKKRYTPEEKVGKATSITNSTLRLPLHRNAWVSRANIATKGNRGHQLLISSGTI